MLTGSNNPYDILGIDRGADKKAIKRAYAELVKQYHPEEYPEEWKRIHDAYEQAMKLASEKKQKVAVLVPQESPEREEILTDLVKVSEQKETPSTPIGTPEQTEAPNTPIGMPEQREAPNTPIGTPEQKEAPNTPIGTPEQKQAPNTPIGSTAPKIRPEVSEAETEDIFGEVEEIANKQHEEEEKAAEEKLKSAMHEIWQLSRDNKFKIEEWRKFFEQEDLLPIISQKKFLQELGYDFGLKQIDEDLYEYLNEQLNVISDYIKVNSTDSAGGRKLAAVEFARSKVKAAYRYRLSVKEERRTRIGKWIGFIAVAVIFVLVLISVDQEEKRKQQESIERQEFYQEMQQQQREQMERWDEWTQDKLDESMESGEWPNYTLEEMLEEGLISQELYEYMLEYNGIDQDQPGTETTEESSNTNKK